MFQEFKTKFNIQKEEFILPDINKFYINKDDLKQVLRFLKESDRYLFETLEYIIRKDNTNSALELIYALYSSKYNTKCAVSINIQDDFSVPSVVEIFPCANFDEREIYDLLGVRFINHPKLERILLPSDFEGNPLRKNYKMQDDRLRWNYE